MHAKVLGLAKQAPSKLPQLNSYVWSMKQFMLQPAQQQQVRVTEQQYEKWNELHSCSIIKLCKMSRLYEMSGKEMDSVSREELRANVEKIMNCLQRLQEVNVENVEPMYSPLQQSENCHVNGRTDTIVPQNKQDILQHAAQRRGKYYVVPKVIEQSEVME